MGLRFKSLGSGSSGNATLVEARSATSVAYLLVDCGFSPKQLTARLQQAGIEPAQLAAIFITHEHSDHIGSAASFAPRHRIPVIMSRGTHAAIGRPEVLDDLVQFARDGEAIDLGALQITPFTVPHDAREPLQLLCSDGDRVLGMATDLGHASAHVAHMLQGAHALLLESNHCPDLLAQSKYPSFLKARVGGDFGHLSNQAAAGLAAHIQHSRLGHVLAAHLSERNNRPELAAAALSVALNRTPADIWLADAEHGSAWLTV